MNFWDASAIVPLCLHEGPRELLLELLEGEPSLVVWWGTPVECVSAVARREREGHLSTTGVGAALDRLRVLGQAWHEVLPSEEIRRIAQRLLRVHPLRAADALQLSAAIVASEHRPGALDFVSLDERLNVAADREGFRSIGG